MLEHQVQTYQALTTGEVDVLINIAMTGDGKSLAAQLPTLTADRPSPLMAMYPTNELISDQVLQFEQAKIRWNRPDLQVTRLDAHQLDQIEAETELRRADALVHSWRNHEVVLTNPDIFHYVMEQYYIRTGLDASDRVLGPLLQLFDHLVFDEFHVFQAPQVVSVINALLFIHEVTGAARPRKFVFLSATPEPLLLEYLQRAGLRYTVIEGQYAHGPHTPDPLCWRPILRGCTLDMSPQTAEEWIEAHRDDTLLPFFLERRPGAKGAIIVNSVAAALRIVEHLRSVLAAHGLSVASNTGFDAAERRRTSYQADLLVGTSTIDVGVDFRINFLLFESRDAGTFLQRLGRLGRHDEYERDGTLHRFPDFQAHALVPPWIHARFFEAEHGSMPLLSEGMEVDREQLSAIVREAFPQPTTFQQYGHLWGGLQAARIIRGLYHRTIKGAYTGTRERLAERYRQVLRVSIRSKLAEIAELEKEAPLLLEEAWSFRGGGDLISGVIDAREHGSAQIKVYDLMGLLANFEVTLIDQAEFYEVVERCGLPRRAYERHDLASYWRAWGVRPERKGIQIVLNQAITGWRTEHFGVAQVLDHVEVDGQGIEGLTTLNRHLARRKMVVLLCLLSPAELSRRLRLPQPFPIYRFVSRDRQEGSISFGRQALLLETTLNSRPDIGCGGGSMIV
ncbi:MAG: type I-D CRISPR-associated helicase Cas3' [Candidatus Entotheonellia bacterium]